MFTTAVPLLLLLLSCDFGPKAPEKEPALGPIPDVTAVEPTLRRLTTDQYLNTLRDLLGKELLFPSSLEPDTALSGLYSVGAAQTSLSAFGVERYEEAAYLIAGQMVDSTHRASWIPCEPVAARDDDCATQALKPLSRMAWRRPLSEEEMTTLLNITGNAGETLGDFYGGMQYGLAMILQSPYFLYRVELGEEDPENPGVRRFSSLEMASRLSYFFWNTTPDDELLQAGESGALLTEDGLTTQVDRLLASERAREGVRNFFTEMLSLYLLDDLSKDPTIFVHFSQDVGQSAKEQTLSDVERLTLTENADFRSFFTSQDTYVDRKLAAIYNVRAPSRDGFGLAHLEDSDGRRGFLGQLSFLALWSHPVSTSATRRGKFIREVLLCQTVLPPPANLNTSIPEATEDAPTLRQRVEVHLTDPSCAGCHQVTDPIGLGFENFDGLGSWRTTENGATIDPSGELDGQHFDDAWDLGGLIHDNERFPGCLTKTMYQYAVGHSAAEGEKEEVDWLAEDFARSGYKVQGLMRAIARSPGFRQAGEVVP